MKHLNLLFKFLTIPFLFIQRYNLQGFLLITFSFISINSTAYADACSIYSDTNKTACEAVGTCKWTGATGKGTCATISTGGAIKLELYKNASPQYIDENRTITYILTFINGTNSDGNYTLHDDMPDNLFDDSDYGISESGNLNCDINTSRTEELVCTGIVPAGSVAHVIYTITAPDTGMQITNTVSVTEDADSTVLLTASVTVTVLPNYNGDLDYNRDICYIPITEEPNSCSYSNQFSYGEPCKSEIQLFHVSDRELLNVHIFKSYSSTIETDSCYTLSDGVECNKTVELDDILHRETSLFFKDAFDGILDFNLGNFSPDQNETLVDIDTENNSSDVDFQYIALIGQYNIQGESDTVEEYIYSCFDSTGGYVSPDTSGGANDINLINNDFSAEDNSVALNIPYQTYNKVGTKIVNQPFLLGITYLDANKNPADFSGSITDESDKTKPVSAAIVLQWKANGTEHALWSGELAPDDDDLPDTLITYKKFSNDLDNTRPYPIIDEAFENGQILVKLVDYPSFLAALDKGSPCAKNSSFTGNLCNVPSCFDSSQQIFNVFPVEQYPLVATCVYGDGGGAAPCDSNAYNGHCQGNKLTISPEKYNEYDGCAQCLADAVATVESSNSFSTRPYSYELSVQEDRVRLSTGEKLWEAGVNYIIDLNATTADNTIKKSPDYNTQLEGYNPPTVIAVIGLDYNTSLSCPYDTNESQLIQFTQGSSIGPIAYSNVGKTTLTIMDQNWTRVDQVGADSEHYECIYDSNATDPTQDPLHLGRVGCKILVPEPMTMTFVPSSFDIEANLTNHNTSANFTYLNDFNGADGVTDMAANLNINVSAINAEGNVTTNYIDGCYAKDNNLSLTFDEFNITSPTNNSLTHMLYYNVIDDNKSDIFIPTPRTNITSLPEPLRSTAANFKPADLGNSTFQYKLNFNRQIDKVVQAFKLNLIDVNMTDTDNVTGSQSGITGQTAIMHYAKARPSVGIGNTYDNIKTEFITTPILIHIYCDPSTSVCSALSLNSYAGANWWLAEEHNANIGDGNITLKEVDPLVDIMQGAGTPEVNPTEIRIASGGIENSVTVNRGPTPKFVLEVNIELNPSTDAWLIHNPDNFPFPPSPFYKVKFISPSPWVGVGGTGSVVDTEVNTNSNKRMSW